MKSIKRITMLYAVAVLFLLIAVSALAGCTGNNGTKIKNISVNSTGAKTVYYYGEELDTGGLVVTAHMKDGTSREVDLNECVFEGFSSFYAIEGLPVTVNYRGNVAEYGITVIVTKESLLEGLGNDKTLASGFLQEGRNIIDKYGTERINETVFYGASNFAYWKDAMEKDLKPYKVQNHAFGGSSDKDLVAYAPYLLYPYNPSFVFFQTGSNDYVQSSKPTDEEKIKEAMDYKKQMFSAFHEIMPDSTFIVMAGILLPGRAEYLGMTQEINRQLKEYCDSLDYLRFVDSEAMTYDSDAGFKDNLFLSDKIHLTPAARIIWSERYILPELEAIGAPRYAEL